MKRFVGFITMCAAMIVGLGVGFIPTLKGVNGNADYSSSKEFVFKISDRAVEDGSFNGTGENNELSMDENAIDYVIDTFKARLDSIKISSYKIEKMGDDMIKVTYKADDSFYTTVTDYLTFSWSMMASTYGDTPVTVGNTASMIKSNKNDTNDFFVPGSATIEYKNNYPYVVVELSDGGSKFKDLYQKARSDEDDDHTNGKRHVLREGEQTEEEVTKPENKIYILNDWLEGYSIKDLVDKKETSNLSKEEYHNHVLFELDATKPETFFWNYDSTNTENENNFKKIYFGGYDLNGNISEGATYGKMVESASEVYFKSLVWSNIFNASSYKYQVTNVNKIYFDNNNNVPPLNEYIVYMDEVQMSKILIATLCTIILITLVYIFNYGANGILGSITTIATSMLALGLANILGVEFNIGAILGILALIFASLFSSMSFFNKIKKEIYNGKNFKKAFVDGSKKAQWITIDISIVGILIGIVAYLIPMTSISSFGIITLIGSVVNLILNTLVLKGVSWFNYNSLYIQNKPKLIALDKKLIPDLSKDEKPVYAESFKKGKTKKTTAIASIVSATLLVASIAGMIGFGTATGSVFNTSSNELNSEIYIRQDMPSRIDNMDKYIVSFEDNFDSHFSKNSDGTEKLIKKLDIDYYYFTYTNGNTTKYEYTYIIPLDLAYENMNSTVFYRETPQGNFEEKSIVEAFTHYASSVVGLNNVDQDSVELQKVYNVDNDAYLTYIFLFIGISSILLFVYFLIRYGAARALVGTILNAAALFITIGLFSLVHIQVSSMLPLAILALFMFNAGVLITMYCGEKEKYKENKKLFKANLASRYESYYLSNNMDFVFNKNISLISLFPIISLIFVNSISFYLPIAILLGVVIVVPIVYYLSLDGEKIVNKVWVFFTKNITFKKPNKKKIDSKTDEGPEEATFIGIND